MREGKSRLRQTMRDRARGADPDSVRAAGDAIQGAVLRLSELDGAGTVGCYLALPDEVGTDLLLAGLWARGQRTCVPAWHAASNRYVLAWLAPDDVRARGPSGVPEPADPREVGSEPVDVLVVPGVAFDLRCARLGHGRGHYDRLLADRPGALRVGLAFSRQVVPALPVEPHDESMDLVVTEGQIIRRGEPRRFPGKE